ncbi:hypothetical protein [Rhodococcus sp. JS3073]|uniref:hypothetical protein n=1 Tax=Rhodococcus sp. JS3073 TaxID=3002901 RepID=UPI00228543FA|nr:hypothetical protein [Rhodococcus sp. JS3073]WAM16332.1 hypothetical protein OYT95_06835 [Rhodococcus sp. JS3073]
MTDSDTRRFSVIHGGSSPSRNVDADLLADHDRADVVALHRVRFRGSGGDDEEYRFFVDTVAEYQWARDAAGLARRTLDHSVSPLIEVCDFSVWWRGT